jgi:hypothetical protein
MTARHALETPVEHVLARLITREIAGIAAIDTAISHETAPDYVVMFHDAKMGKQANVEQMATLVRMKGGTPDERGGVRKALTTAQAAISSRVSTTATIRAMRRAEIELVTLYSEALGLADGLVATRALRKALGRAMVHAHLLTAHLAKRTGRKDEADLLFAALDDCFVDAHPRACMRCHLDRPGISGSLERRDPHPYTYICAACHDEVLGEFPPDLAVQADRWPRDVRDAKVMQHAVSHISKLNAVGRVLLPLAGLEAEQPAPAAERALIVPTRAHTPGPAPGERPGALDVEMPDGLEGDYVRELLSVRPVWRNW